MRAPPSACTFNIHTPRRLSNGVYNPAAKKGDISLIYSSGWDKTDDNEWTLRESSFNSASVWLPVNNQPDQALNIAAGAVMKLKVSGSKRTITIDGEIRNPYRMDIEVTITF